MSENTDRNESSAMNTLRIAQAVRDIEENAKALDWLDRYGAQISARDREQASVNVHLAFAGACNGAKEAQAVLSSFARLSLPDLIEQATRNCRNTIAMAEDAIREEAGRAHHPTSQEREPSA